MDKPPTDPVSKFLASLQAVKPGDIPEDDRTCSICNDPCSSGEEIPISLALVSHRVPSKYFLAEARFTLYVQMPSYHGLQLYLQMGFPRCGHLVQYLGLRAILYKLPARSPRNIYQAGLSLTKEAARFTRLLPQPTPMVSAEEVMTTLKLIRPELRWSTAKADPTPELVSFESMCLFCRWTTSSHIMRPSLSNAESTHSARYFGHWVWPLDRSVTSRFQEELALSLTYCTNSWIRNVR